LWRFFAVRHGTIDRFGDHDAKHVGHDAKHAVVNRFEHDPHHIDRHSVVSGFQHDADHIDRIAVVDQCSRSPADHDIGGPRCSR
jgi:hypothetical protein